MRHVARYETGTHSVDGNTDWVGQVSRTTLGAVSVSRRFWAACRGFCIPRMSIFRTRRGGCLLQPMMLVHWIEVGSGLSARVGLPHMAESSIPN